MSFEAVVFAGGGCRCFWQVGFWSALAPTLEEAPWAVAATSAGAAGAITAFSNKSEAIVDEFIRRTADNPKNAYWGNLLRGKPVFPHERMYREIITTTICESTLAELHEGPEIRVLIGHPPLGRSAGAALLAGLVAYRFERKARRRLHVQWPQRLGFQSSIATVQDCQSPADLADLLLHASCTPPVTRRHVRDGRPVVDGGIIDPAPAFVVEEARTQLVMLSRDTDRRSLPTIAGRTYVVPSRPIGVSTWDYANPEGVRDAYELGLADGERFSRARRRLAKRRPPNG